MGNKVVSAHSLESVLLYFWEAIEKVCFDLSFYVAAEVSLSRKKMLGPMRDALGRGNAEGKVRFIANFLRRARCGDGNVPSLVKGLNGWLDHSIEGLKK